MREPGDMLIYRYHCTREINRENTGGYMKFHELPQKWKITVTILRIIAVVLPITFIVNVWMTLGSLLMVMVGG